MCIYPIIIHIEQGFPLENGLATASFVRILATKTGNEGRLSLISANDQAYDVPREISPY